MVACALADVNGPMGDLDQERLTRGVDDLPRAPAAPSCIGHLSLQVFLECPSTLYLASHSGKITVFFHSAYP